MQFSTCTRISNSKNKHAVNAAIIVFSIYTLSNLGVVSNLIGCSLSLANEHYSPPTEWIMRKPNKNNMARVKAWIERSIKSLMVSFWKCCWDHFLCIYENNYSSQSRWIVAEYLPRFQRIIVNYSTHALTLLFLSMIERSVFIALVFYYKNLLKKSHDAKNPAIFSFCLLPKEPS